LRGWENHLHEVTADRVRQQTNHQHAWQVMAVLSRQVELVRKGQHTRMAVSIYMW